MYSIVIRKKFNASHALRRGRDVVEAPHDHRWLVEVHMRSHKLDDSGCVVDFRDLDRTLDEMLKPLEGASMHELERFADASPSAEAVAKMFFEELRGSFRAGSVELTKVTVWEDGDHGGSYSELI